MKESTNSKLLNFVVCGSCTKTKLKSKITPLLKILVNESMPLKLAFHTRNLAY